MVTLEQAKKLNTKRLVTYYKKYAHKWQHKYECPDCGKVPIICMKEYKELKVYWRSIKNMLDLREHVEV